MYPASQSSVAGGSFTTKKLSWMSVISVPRIVVFPSTVRSLQIVKSWNQPSDHFCVLEPKLNIRSIPGSKVAFTVISIPLLGERSSVTIESKHPSVPVICETLTLAIVASKSEHTKRSSIHALGHLFPESPRLMPGFMGKRLSVTEIGERPQRSLTKSVVILALAAQNSSTVSD